MNKAKIEALLSKLAVIETACLDARWALDDRPCYSRWYDNDDWDDTDEIILEAIQTITRHVLDMRTLCSEEDDLQASIRL